MCSESMETFIVQFPDLVYGLKGACWMIVSVIDFTWPPLPKYVIIINNTLNIICKYSLFYIFFKLYFLSSMGRKFLM